MNETTSLALSMAVIGFDGPVLPAPVARLLSRGLAGVALFGRNIFDRGQVAELCASIRDAARGFPPPIVAVDQEGGRVQRLRRITDLVPAMREVHEGGAVAAKHWGRAVGESLAALGFNLDFAPVLDVDSNPTNPIIGDRSFSSDPEVVSGLGLAFIEGMREAGVAECVKHFPGHGDASADSHLDLPVIAAPADLIASRELVPFAAAARAGAGMVMTAHCLYPALDPLLPATLSPLIVTGLLRERLGYDGCVISDDLGMKAISDRFGRDEVPRLGLEAGLDLFLECGGGGEGEELLERLERMVVDGEVDRGRFGVSAGRVGRLRAGLR